MTAPTPNFTRNAIPGASPCVLALREELRANRLRTIGTFEIAGRTATIVLGHDSLWAIIRRDGARLALRAAYAPGGLRARRLRAKTGEALRVRLVSAIGKHVVTFAAIEHELPLIRVTTRLTPSEDLLVPHLPRDLYPLGPNDNPLDAEGNVEAAQRGMNGGLLYWHLGGDTPGSLLYVQNLTAMNAYYNATETRPDGAVGGEWPELGYLPPTPPQSGTPPVNPLPKGQEVTISDALLVFHKDAPQDEAHSARLFLQMLGSAYPLIDKPIPEYHDWPDRAKRTLRDLATAPEATIRHYGHTYIHPYTASEYPDSMVQVTLLASIHDFGRWLGKTLPLEKKLAAGLDRFFDAELGTIRRYLPNVGKDKDADAVDSWYLYHPLLGLGRLALDGDTRARRLFEGSLDFAIRAARHFHYKWPIQYKVTDFSIITGARDDQGLGQTDVGGIYAYVMLVAFELTDDPRFLAEARTAIDAARGMRFNLNYQANLTAWGASACMRLWRITNEERYLKQSYVYLAGFFHNSVLWNSQIGAARNYRTFLGVTALHDAPYMALYECFDSFAALERYLKDGGPDLDAAVRLLVSNYCRFALDRAWFYYPDALPRDLLCPKPRNGHIDPGLSFPLEDLYVGGDIAGQVGQEIYGAGAAFVFASRAFHHVDGAPFGLFCDMFLLASDRTSDTSLSFQICGDPGDFANLHLIRKGRATFANVLVESDPGGRAIAAWRGKDRIHYRLPANARIRLHW
ncbi:MAG TPA: hypothetical protein VNT42_03430 [Sphingomonas sp.]|nr:hypothetical protein [Sphingomonas sp.]